MLFIEPNLSYYKCHHKSSDNIDKWATICYSMLLTLAISLALQPPLVVEEALMRNVLTCSRLSPMPRWWRCCPPWIRARSTWPVLTCSSLAPSRARPGCPPSPWWSLVGRRSTPDRPGFRPAGWSWESRLGWNRLAATSA